MDHSLNQIWFVLKHRFIKNWNYDFVCGSHLIGHSTKSMVILSRLNQIIVFMSEQVNESFTQLNQFVQKH